MFIGWLTAFTDNEFGEKGSTMLEYSLLAALLTMVIVVAVSFMGEQTEETFVNVREAMGGKEAPGPVDPQPF